MKTKFSPFNQNLKLSMPFVSDCCKRCSFRAFKNNTNHSKPPTQAETLLAKSIITGQISIAESKLPLKLKLIAALEALNCNL